MDINFHLTANDKIVSTDSHIGKNCQWVEIKTNQGELTFFTETYEDAQILEEAFRRLIKNDA